MNKAELIDEVEELILTGGRRTTAVSLRTVLIDMINSYDESSSEKGVTAYAGGGEPSAYQISKVYTRVDIASADNASLKFDAAVGNTKRIVQNNTGYVLNLYPKAGEKFYGYATNDPFILQPGQQLTVLCYNEEAGIWSIV